MSPKVFISSTCYDLIDIRAELEILFKEMGLTPLLSDSLTSEFTVQSNSNSIETCLVNVRDCDYYVIILSQRYGGLLNNGYGEISATHLEYREAKKHEKPIHMYIRDRLEADHAVKLKNENAKLSWIKDQKDEKLFDIINEHRPLQKNADSTNWFWTFRNSIDIKNRITQDFKKISHKVKALENENSPLIIPIINNIYINNNLHSKSIQVTLTAHNHGRSIAFKPLIKIALTSTLPTKELINNGFSPLLVHNTETKLISFTFDRFYEHILDSNNFQISIIFDMQYETIDKIKISEKTFIDAIFKNSSTSAHEIIYNYQGKEIINE